jgi:hypothetical protein
MAKSDHIKVWRGSYWHHGIDVGDGHVIHFTGGLGHKKNAVIKKTIIKTFQRGRECLTVRYAQSLVPDVVIERAYSLLGQANYSLFFNNCEHFACYCKTGRKESEQVKDAAATGGAAVGTGLLSTGAIAGVSAAGTVSGLSAAGIMSGLAAIGPGGAVGGVVTLAALPAAATNYAVNKILKDNMCLSKEERTARKAGRIAAKAGTVAGAIGAVSTISAAGTTAGLSAAGITSGLAAIGSTVGCGMITGVAMSVAAPAVAAGFVGFGIYKAWRYFSEKLDS